MDCVVCGLELYRKSIKFIIKKNLFLYQIKVKCRDTKLFFLYIKSYCRVLLFLTKINF